MRIRELVPWRSRQNQQPSRNLATSFEQGMRQMFDEFFEGFDLAPFGKTFGSTDSGMPKVDVAETKDAVQVTAELPGMDEKDVEVTLSDGHLVIRGEKKSDTEDTQKSYHRIERTYGSFQRSVPLPAEVDALKVEASFHNGVLTVVLPKTETAGSGKKIPVRRQD